MATVDVAKYINTDNNNNNHHVDKNHNYISNENTIITSIQVNDPTLTQRLNSNNNISNNPNTNISTNNGVNEHILSNSQSISTNIHNSYNNINASIKPNNIVTHPQSYSIHNCTTNNSN